MDLVSADTTAPGGRTEDTSYEDKNTSRNIEKGRVLTQIVAAFAVHMSEFVFGTNYGFTAILFPQLLEKNEIPMTKENMSWIASLFSVGLITGSPLGGVLGRRLGLKTAIRVGCLVHLPGWILIAGADSVEMIYIGRILTGIGAGLTFSNGVSFISDISEPRLRGMLQAVGMVTLNIGCTLVYVAGALFDWRWTPFLSSGFLLSCVLICSFIPESPVWLVSNGRMEDAGSALLWLRGKHYNVEPELRHIREAIEANPANRTWRDNICSFTQTRVLKPFFVLLFLIFSLHCSGMTVINMYTINILEAANSSLDEYLAAMIIAAGNMIGNIIAVILLHIFGRRPILIASFFFCSLMLGLAGLSFYILLSHVQTIREIWEWIILLSLTAFSISYGYGVGAVPWVLMGEIFPEDVSAFAAGLTTSLSFVFMFLTVKFFPTFETIISLHGTLWLYSGINIMGMIETIFFVPETKGKTFGELQALYRGRKTVDAQIQ